MRNLRSKPILKEQLWKAIAPKQITVSVERSSVTSLNSIIPESGRLINIILFERLAAVRRRVQRIGNEQGGVDRSCDAAEHLSPSLSLSLFLVYRE